MNMQPFVLIHHNGYGWSFMLALIIGLVVSSVFTGLSVGLPLGLVCCTSDPTYTEYDNFQGPDFAETATDLYSIVQAYGTNTFSLCQSVCNADPECAYFDFATFNEGEFCYLYPESQLSAITTPITGFTSNVYIKNGYSFSASS